MTTRIKATLTALALTGLAACERAERQDLLNERADADYQSAMADYSAGRIDQAIAGFRKVCRRDPANASAHFQLGCLLQDTGRDYFGACCAYAVYQLQHPESDKAKLARDRAAICELEAARQLAEKHGLLKDGAVRQELDAVRDKLKDAETQTAKARDDLATAMQRIAHLRQENERLRTALRGDAGADASPAAAAKGVKDAKALLDEDDSDRISQSADLAALRREADADANLPAPIEMPGASAKVRYTEAPTSHQASAEEPKHEKRPDVYVVQEGDTLYKIAMRFYGRRGAWKLIRDANKAVISTDGRVNAGMHIKLPDPK